MNLQRIKFLMLLCVVMLSCDTGSDFEGDFENYFVKYYGEDGNQEGVDMIVNEADGTLLLLGTTRLPDNSSRVLLVKTNFDGDVLWQKNLGGFSENAADIEPTGDGNFLILSNMYLGKDISTNEDRFDMKILKVTPDGVKLDSMIFNNNEGNDKKWSTQYMRSICTLSDGGFIVTGNSTDETIFTEPFIDPDQEDIITIVFNEDLSYRWKVEATFAEYIGSGVKVFEKSGMYYLMGYSDKLDGVVGGDLRESNFNVFGITQTQYAEVAGFGGSPAIADDEVLRAAIVDPFGNGYYEIGTQSKLPQTYGDLYYANRNGDFVITQQGTVKGITGAFNAAAAAPSIKSNGFLILANELLATGVVMRLINVDLDNNARWSLSLGSASNQNTGASVAELSNGRIVVLGTIGLETQRKMALIKVDANGEFLN